MSVCLLCVSTCLSLFYFTRLNEPNTKTAVSLIILNTQLGYKKYPGDPTKLFESEINIFHLSVLSQTVQIVQITQIKRNRLLQYFLATAFKLMVVKDFNFSVIQS